MPCHGLKCVIVHVTCVLCLFISSSCIKLYQAQVNTTKTILKANNKLGSPDSYPRLQLLFFPLNVLRMPSSLPQSPLLPRGRTDKRNKEYKSFPASIPTLRGCDISHRPLIDCIYQILPSTGKVTVVCGAGISTHAGIPVRCA